MFEQLPNAPTKFGVSPPDFELIRDGARSFAGIAAYRTVEYELSGVAESRRLIGAASVAGVVLRAWGSASGRSSDHRGG